MAVSPDVGVGDGRQESGERPGDRGQSLPQEGQHEVVAGTGSSGGEGAREPARGGAFLAGPRIAVGGSGLVAEVQRVLVSSMLTFGALPPCTPVVQSPVRVTLLVTGMVKVTRVGFSSVPM